MARRTGNLDADHLYLKGRTLLGRRELGTAVACLTDAIRLDPDYAPSHATLAHALAVVGFYGFAPGYEALRQAKHAAERAVRLDPTLDEAHAAVFFLNVVYDRDWDLLETQYARAMDAGASSLLLNWRSLYLSLAAGRAASGARHGRRVDREGGRTVRLARARPP